MDPPRSRRFRGRSSVRPERVFHEVCPASRFRSPRALGGPRRAWLPDGRRGQPGAPHAGLPAGRRDDQGPGDRTDQPQRPARREPQVQAAVGQHQRRRSREPLGRRQDGAGTATQLQARTLQPRGKEADIGSNDKGFWFWTRPGPGQPKEIFVCDYDATGKSPLEGPLQPDWIIESLGLREITEDEAAGITIEPTNSPNGDTVALAQSFRGGSGATYKKVTLVDKSSGLVRENRLYRIDKDRKTPLATAVVSDSQRVSLPADEAKAPDAPCSVVLPSKVKLAWYTPDRQNPDIPQKLEIDVRLLGPPELNKPVPHELFEEYTYKGLVRVPLNEPFGIAKSSSTEIRETRPAPGPACNWESRTRPRAGPTTRRRTMARRWPCRGTCRRSPP